jgi:hypothetical protein
MRRVVRKVFSLFLSFWFLFLSGSLWLSHCDPFSLICFPLTAVPPSPIRTVYFSDNDQFLSVVSTTSVLIYSLLNLVMVHQQDLLAPSSAVPQLTISPAESVASLSTGTFRSPITAEVLGALHVPQSLSHTFAAALLNPKRSWRQTDASSSPVEDDSDPVALLRRRETQVPPTSANLLVLIQQKPFPRPDKTLLWANAIQHSSSSSPVVQSVQPRAPVPPSMSLSASNSSSSVDVEASPRPNTARRARRPGTGSGASTPRGSVDESAMGIAGNEFALSAPTPATSAVPPHGTFSLRCLALPTLLLPRQNDDMAAAALATSRLARRGSLDESSSTTHLSSASTQSAVASSVPASTTSSTTDVFQPLESCLSLSAMALLSTEAAHAFFLGSTGGSVVASTTAAFMASVANPYPSGACPLSASCNWLMHRRGANCTAL